MNYEFHVGDYVAYSTNDRTCAGYVKKYMHPVFSNEYCFVFQWDDGSQFGWSGSIEELPHNFVRIGQYDFTKKEKKTIKKLNLQGYLSTQTVAYVVNELVDVVNKLMNKENEE